MTSFDALVAEATAAPFSGWDLSWLAARTTHEHVPWSYSAEVARLAGAAAAMLDLGTGGGERLARIVPRPSRTVATESWRPNVSVAASRLRPLGIGVIECESAPENMKEEALVPRSTGLLPFRDGAFDLVINRHESFRADEVHRVLAPGGTFITQQVDNHSDDDLYRLLGLDPPDAPDSWLQLATRQLTEAGCTVTTAASGEQVRYFNDVAAVVYYLRVIAWAIPDYSLDAFRPRLRSAFETKSLWPLPVRHRSFLVVATKPCG